jgi:hypothetical protein
MDTHIPSTIPLISYGNVKAAKKASSSHSSTPSEMLDTDREETHTNHGVIKVSELPYLFENYRDFLGEHRTFESAERRITNGLHAFIGLKQALWIEAIKTLPPGYAVIMFAIALEFMARTQKSGAAYFVGMWRKYDRDELNLHGTIMGRRKKIAV